MSPRALLIGIFALAALVTAASPAAAGPILEEADAAELAQLLADAADEQDICYGWVLTIQDRQNGGLITDVGSSTGGPGARMLPSMCDKYAQLVVDGVYTDDFEEAEDSASYSIDSNFLPPDAPLGVSGDDFVGDNDDVALFNATAQLPALAAEQGEAPWVQPDPNVSEIPSSDKLTGSPSGDWFRSNWGLVAVLVLATIASVAWLLYELFGERVLKRYSSW